MNQALNRVTGQPPARYRDAGASVNAFPSHVKMGQTVPRMNK